MKFLAGLAVAASLASSAAAAAATAPVYLLRSSSSSSSSTTSSSSTSPNLPRQIARQILLQRLDASDGSSFFDTLPRDFDPETALDLIQQFGSKATPALFVEDSSSSSSSPRQMVVVVQGAKAEHVAALESALPSAFAKPAFSVADPPSEAANTRLFVDELAGEGIVAHTETSVADAVADGAPTAWANGVFVGLYDAKKNPSTVDDLVKALPQITAVVEAGAADVAILVLPESSRYAQWKQWASSKGLKPANARILPPKARPAGSELRIRNAEEMVIEEGSTEFKEKNDKQAAPPHNFVAAPPAASIPGCFQSFNACIAQTNNCSEHGTCVDKYAINNGGLSTGAAGGSCFMCHCYSTLNRPEDSPGGLSTTKWAGNMCQKKDVSVPFWLITGFTVTIIGAVTFAIGLLFSVGEEKLPGVIGAGVSRAK